MNNGEITIIKPDDWHLHLRDLPGLKDALAHTVERFARAVVMPNLKPPVSRLEHAVAYKNRILESLPDDSFFDPLMTIYLTDSMDPKDIKRFKENGEIFAIKLYPAGATTNSEHGLTSIEKAFSVFEAMQNEGLPLLIHGEISGPEIDIFDRERLFIEKHLSLIIRTFPGLRLVLEHVSTKEGVDFVKESSENVGATITPHHLILTRNDVLEGGIRPHHYCMPIVKTERDRKAIREAATSGHPRFFAGTDSAPHPRSSKESAKGSAGIYSSNNAVEIYAAVFEKENALDKLEAFLSINGAHFHNVETNRERITLKKESRPVPEVVEFGDDEVVPLRAGEMLDWSIVG